MRLLTIILTLPALAACEAAEREWPSWRGPEQTGFVRENAVVTGWSLSGENLIWKSPEGGRSSPVLLNGRIYFIAPAGSGETLGEHVVCLDGDTGKLIWEHKFNVYLSTIVENRVGWTSVVGDPETGNIYAHGTGGMFFCFDKDGKILWRRSLTELYNRVSGYGGRIHTPIVDEDKVIISFFSSGWGSHGPPAHRYLAMDKNTGDVIWWAKPGGRPLDTTYGAPFVTVINGVRMLIGPNADGYVYVIKARTGQKVWYFRLSKRGLNTSIVGQGKHVFVSHGEENLHSTDMGGVVCLDASLKGDITESGVIWRKDGITAGYASPALANGRLYVCDNSAKLHCFDAMTGKLFWKRRTGRVAKGSPVVTADGVIYYATVNGRFSILKDAGDRCEELHVTEFPPVDGFIEEIYGSPAVANGRVHLVTRNATFCLGKIGARVESQPIPPMPAEAEPDPSKPGALLTIPGEITLAPGEKQQFSLRLFDSNGRQLDLDHAGITHEIKGVRGSLGEHGVFAAATDPVCSAGTLTFKLGAVSGSARIRVSPSLPINETFDGMAAGKVPPGWLGVGAKSKLVEMDGNMVLEKLAERPSVPFMRMRAYSGPPISIEGGYTVECDLMGRPRAKGRPIRPDMGLFNCRYALKMMGREKTLRLVTWSPIPRLREETPFDWKTDVWYRAKLRVEIKNGKGLIRGKAWPRDEAEPEGWQVKMIDPCPISEGSPGLYAYSKGTTTSKKGAPNFYDNYKVYAND